MTDRSYSEPDAGTGAMARRHRWPMLNSMAPAIVVAVVAVAAVLALAACSTETTTPTSTSTSPITTATPASAVASPTATPDTEAISPTAGTSTGAVDEVPLYDPELIRNDVDCSWEFVTSGGGEDFPEAFVVAHYVVDGILGEPCSGVEDERLLEVWRWLRVLVPADELEDLILLAGYEADVDLLAYVESLTARDGSISFQMTLNLTPEAMNEVDLPLTVAHEFTHVFTGRADALDRSIPAEECTTYHEGSGCYARGSHIARWTEAFWGDWIHEVQGDPDSANNDDAAGLRCFLDDSFLGTYAASNPEEDFAETFSAYVFSVPVDTPGLVAKMEFMDADPYLRSFRERIQDAGIAPFPSRFEGCGY